MAQTEHLPIYKAAYELCLYFEQLVRGFSRYHKYSLGQDLRDGARRVLKLIVRANARREKGRVLLQVREEVEELKVVLRLCHDAQALPTFKSFEHAIRLVTDIARQNEGWLKSQQRGRGQNRRVILDEIAEPSVP
ncbi:four helix bundle protein [bacterium]|nr:four helix bundle protein [bacterium]